MPKLYVLGSTNVCERSLSYHIGKFGKHKLRDSFNDRRHDKSHEKAESDYQMNTQTFHKLGKKGIVRNWTA